MNVDNVENFFLNILNNFYIKFNPEQIKRLKLETPLYFLDKKANIIL